MDNLFVYVDIHQGGQMSDVQCKKNRNESIDIKKAIKHFETDNVCLSCLEYDACRIAKEESEEN